MIVKSAFLIGILLISTACSRSPEEPQQLGNTDLARISAKMSGLPYANPKVELYNGTEWIVTDVDIILTNKRTNEDRRFRFDGSVNPMSDGSLKGSIGTFLLDGLEREEGGYSPSVAQANTWTWSIVRIRGVKNR